MEKLPSQVITAENLSLTTNIPHASDAGVKLNMSDAQNGVLTLHKVVRGTDELEVKVTVAEQADGTFKFQGEESISASTKAAWQVLNSIKVRVSGSITVEGKADVAVSTEASGDIVKKFYCVTKLFMQIQKIELTYTLRVNWCGYLLMERETIQDLQQVI